MRRFVAFLVVWLLAVVATAPSCNIFQDIGNAECSLANQGEGGDNGGGGDDGAGGEQGGGGGVYSSDVGVGAGPPTGADVGVGAGPGSSADVGVGAGPGARTPPRWRRPRNHRRGGSGIGTAAQADCMEPAVPAMAPRIPILVGLTTTKLRAIAAYLQIGQGLTGIQLNNRIGLAFENWVLFMLNQTHWKTVIPSPERKAKTGGLPAGVIPDYVSDLTLFSTDTGGMTFPLSEFWEVKAVNGALTPSTSQYQIVGLLDVARNSAAGTSTLPKHPPPVVLFTTTSNTTVGKSTLAQATQWGVAVWQQTVAYDATDPTDPNPDLCFGEVGPLNQDVYPAGGTVQSEQLTSACSKLLSPTTAPVVPPGDPDPPTVDG